jgi:nicotinamidase-related amidase
MESKPVEEKDTSSALPRSPELMNREDSALLVVDAQVKLLEVVPESERIVWNIRRLLDAAAALGVPIAATEQYPDRLSPTAPELKQRIGPAPDKLCFSACVCGEILERWKRDSRYRVLVCGIESHVCIMQTALDLGSRTRSHGCASGWSAAGRTGGLASSRSPARAHRPGSCSEESRWRMR